MKIVECRLCNEVYSLQGDNVPRLLLCGHSVCHRCLSQIPMQPNHTILCPFDRCPTVLGDSGIWGLKKNFALIEFIEKFNADAALQTVLVGAISSTSCSNFSSSATDIKGSDEAVAVPCDEDDNHGAVIYCTVCRTNLCLECSVLTHNTRTLSKHSRIPLSQKQVEIPKCAYHPMHAIEFVCLEEACQRNPFMCYICKDYGRHQNHKHNLLECEVDSLKAYFRNSINNFTEFTSELTDAVGNLEVCIQAIEHPESGSETISRKYISDYFALLRQNLNEQETAAWSSLDAHIHQKLGSLRNQLDDISSFLTHVTLTKEQLNRSLRLSNMDLVIAKPELTNLTAGVAKQQTDFLAVYHRFSPDHVIPLTFTKDNRLHIGPKLEMRVVLLGLDQAGKTSILFRLKQNEFISTIPTIGFNVETIEYKNVKFTYWDVGGCTKLRPLWKHYYLNTQGLVYVIDSADTQRLEEAFNELCKLLQEPELNQASFLILANKHNQPSSVGIESLMERFNLVKLCSGRSWHIQPCDAMSGDGIPEALDWLSHQLVAFPSLQLQPVDVEDHTEQLAEHEHP